MSDTDTDCSLDGPDHLLHLIEITEEGYAHFRMSCAHPSGPDIPPQWQTRYEPDGQLYPDDGCWFYSWWDALGQELIGHLRVSDPQFPLWVKPSDDWTFDDGGTIVLDARPSSPENVEEAT